ncbi:hypothetical protein A249_20125 [Pseudomonas syringae pv. actinidiae ICMP 18804]|uniref:Uncharacterized protein n=1 Tax=Pseudomonas syringae pv. actinidiae ICMP 19096 TaxID=1194405 RepID=A0A656JIV1_PSESF|nr:hypothetical protein A246_28751 [Pseudomonas syringae pv. actinidiae ICMP 19098]EPM95175.1 hypothetical protein A249_20125 [Pseudomonas syringae pv. actinidiae ICMP 18804]EPN14276.1 hypothetical protein A248_27402 [Pseudomonas syringae pv. actinidiae ICMP 19100]EPN22501.1 hypothetical protein A247_28126 [Pseudomonas syringae pv. actinidiae ICMP 19099]EPN29606.1 hypothetical protein A245_46833 [Pseudomonas syringae pv. actinidiae ICMP 19096]EPN35294.1 hypothetical protein A243_10638 [Pseudom
MAKAGRLIRATRGLYLAAITDQGRYVTPTMARSLGLSLKDSGEIAFDGARSAKMLGLSVSFCPFVLLSFFPFPAEARWHDAKTDEAVPIIVAGAVILAIERFGG